MQYLIKYIEEIVQAKLKLFLCFCTASYLMLKDLADIPFSLFYKMVLVMWETLEVTKSYENYPSFRTEFDGFLSMIFG